MLMLGSALLTGCSSLPKLNVETPAAEPQDTEATCLGTLLAPSLAEHPGMSGVYPLENSLDALTARMVLAAAAEHSLDVQYYIWHADRSGKLLADELIQA